MFQTRKARDCTGIAFVFALYCVAASFGLRVAAVGGFATLVWAPTAIAFVAILFCGRAMWPGVFAAAFLINYLTGAPALAAAGMATGNTLEALVGVALVTRAGDFDPSLRNLKDLSRFVLLVVVCSTLVSAVIGVTSLWATGMLPAHEVPVTLRAWWVGDALGDLLVAPLLLNLRGGTFFLGSRWRRLEGVVVWLLLVGASATVFGEMAGRLRYPPLPYVLFPFVIYLVFRFGQFGASVASFTVAVVAIYGTMHGLGPFASGEPSERLLLLHSFLAILAVTGLVLAAAVEERAAALRDMAKAVKDRDLFLAIASHELKTPLTILLGRLQLAERKVEGGPEDVAKGIRSAIRRGQQLNLLVKELLDISRIRAGRLELRREWLDLSTLIAENLEHLTEETRSARCTVRTELEPGLDGNWDRSGLEQVFVNLYSNALKYAPGTELVVSAHRSGDRACLVVEDLGPGISRDEQSRIFEPFERGDPVDAASGMGLGLYIVKRIVESHVGTVRLESERGRGSRFIVELPLSAG
jgi:signal transduction histidine kinase